MRGMWAMSRSIWALTLMVTKCQEVLSLPMTTYKDDFHPTLSVEVANDFYNEDGFTGCTEGMYSCDVADWCYQPDQQCDGYVDCPDASDEANCPCLRRLQKSRVCDGIYDCPDRSDELVCNGCDGTQLSCYVGGSLTCVEASQMCDGEEHCDDGRDEDGCWRLSLRHHYKWDNQTVRTQGFLQVKRNEVWTTVCGHNNQGFSDIMNYLCLQVVGEDRDGRDKYKLVATGQSLSVWAHLRPNNQVYVSGRCSSSLSVYVRCAEPKCVNSRPKDLESRVRRDHSSSSRIVGGIDSSPDVWTFIVGIQRSGVFICGGSIITSKWVLSAGHCFIDFKKKFYEVQAGMLRRESWSPYEQTRKVTHVVKHKDFQVTHLFNDVVLVGLQTPFQLNRWVRPVCLANTMDLKENTMCTVAGWGNVQQYGDLSDSLQEVQLPTLDSCERDFDFVSDDQVVCAGFSEGRKDACQGDSGGPMMCNGTEGWVQAGVVSYGRGCARAEQPGVYSRVTHYRPWIQDTIGIMRNRSLLPKEGPVKACDGRKCRLAMGSCLPWEYVCDRIVDCLEAEDELECQYFATITNPVPKKSTGLPTTTTTTTTTVTTTTTYQSTFYPTTDHSTTYQTEGQPLNSSTMLFTPCSQQQHLRLDSILEVQCSSDQFMCQNLKECLPWDLVCDGVRHCRDGTDELGCTCLDRLLKFGEDLACDGYLDCFDLSDEACDLCGDRFLCARSRVCLPKEFVCDTKRDCEYGEDELNCIGLVDESGTLHHDRFGQLVERSNGTLVLRSNQEWSTICVNHLPEHVALDVCSYLGYSKVAGVTYEEGPMTLEHEYVPRSAASSRRPKGETGNFLKTPGGSEKRRRSAERRRSRVFQDWRSERNASQGGEPNEALRFLRELKDSSRREKRDVCVQAVVSCKRQACGKVPLYFYSSETPVWMPGGAPWAASVYVEGQYRCGATLVRPRWAITSKSCMAGVRLDTSLASVVMGSWRAIGEPTRLWGGHEHDRRIVYMKEVHNTDILMLRLANRMPKTPYINHLCLPSNSVKALGEDTWCAMTGRHEDFDRIGMGVAFRPARECPEGHICPVYEDPSQLPCMGSWSGVVACQYTRQHAQVWNPTWVGVGVWTHAGSSDGCPGAEMHQLFDIDVVLTIHSIIEGYSPEPLAKCDGEVCVTGVCVTPQERCDAQLSCPDLADEPPKCPDPIVMCEPDFETGFCVCPEGMSPCKDGVCIPEGKICDGEPDCPQATDEEHCLCCKHLREDKLCDGEIHCHDQSDEQYCGCTPDTEYFRCYTSDSQCIDLKSMCDGRKDCNGGEDERHCVTLAPAIIVDENVLGVPEMPPHGYLVVRLNGVWYTYLHSMWEGYLSNLVCMQMGYARANRTEERSLDLNVVGQAARTLRQGKYDQALLFPGNLQRAGAEGENGTVVYIHCTENDVPNH